MGFSPVCASRVFHQYALSGLWLLIFLEMSVSLLSCQWVFHLCVLQGFFTSMHFQACDYSFFSKFQSHYSLANGFFTCVCFKGFSPVCTFRLVTTHFSRNFSLTILLPMGFSPACASRVFHQYALSGLRLLIVLKIPVSFSKQKSVKTHITPAQFKVMLDHVVTFHKNTAGLRAWEILFAEWQKYIFCWMICWVNLQAISSFFSIFFTQDL